MALFIPTMDIVLNCSRGGSQRPQADEPGPSRPRFSGTGHTLGSDDTDSVEVPDPDTVMHHHGIVPTVTRSLTFWRDGFSVEDGPLMRYDDPANQDVLRAIQNGRAPLSLMNVEPGQPADVNVFRRMDEDYVPSKKRPAPFSGAGQRLGSPTPGGSSVPASLAAPVNVQPATSPSSSSSAPRAPTVAVNASSPTTTLQIRLGDGTRLVSSFNHTHTVGDVYGFVNAASLESRSRNYVLQTTFPTKELKDMDQTIKDAGLVNAVVIQRWA
jgi:UBX domain-containing protein 1